jgi:hypothetical protein
MSIDLSTPGNACHPHHTAPAQSASSPSNAVRVNDRIVYESRNAIGSIYVLDFATFPRSLLLCSLVLEMIRKMAAAWR